MALHHQPEQATLEPLVEMALFLSALGPSFSPDNLGMNLSLSSPAVTHWTFLSARTAVGASEMTQLGFSVSADTHTHLVLEAEVGEEIPNKQSKSRWNLQRGQTRQATNLDGRR